MTRNVSGWFVVVVLLGVAIYAVAEDFTLTTYYPSPRGVYQELRVAQRLALGTGVPPARLTVTGPATNPTGGVCPAGSDWYNEDGDGTVDAGECKVTGLVLTDAGSLGLGTKNPFPRLSVIGPTTNPVSGTCPAGYDWYDENGNATLEAGECKQMALRVTETGQVGIGKSSPAERLEVNGNIKLSGATPTSRIMNVADPRVSPTGDYDVATKAYVDAAAGGGGAVLTLIGATGGPALSCPSSGGWSAAQTGYWNCPICPSAGPCAGICFCGADGNYTFGTSDGDNQGYKGYYSDYSNDLHYIRCTVCVK